MKTKNLFPLSVAAAVLFGGMGVPGASAQAQSKANAPVNILVVAPLGKGGRDDWEGRENRLAKDIAVNRMSRAEYNALNADKKRRAAFDAQFELNLHPQKDLAEFYGEFGITDSISMMKSGVTEGRIAQWLDYPIAQLKTDNELFANRSANEVYELCYDELRERYVKDRVKQYESVKAKGLDTSGFNEPLNIALNPRCEASKELWRDKYLSGFASGKNEAIPSVVGLWLQAAQVHLQRMNDPKGKNLNAAAVFEFPPVCNGGFDWKIAADTGVNYINTRSVADVDLSNYFNERFAAYRASKNGPPPPLPENVRGGIADLLRLSDMVETAPDAVDRAFLNKSKAPVIFVCKFNDLDPYVDKSMAQSDPKNAKTLRLNIDPNDFYGEPMKAGAVVYALNNKIRYIFNYPHAVDMKRLQAGEIRLVDCTEAVRKIVAENLKANVFYYNFPINRNSNIYWAVSHALNSRKFYSPGCDDKKNGNYDFTWQNGFGTPKNARDMLEHYRLNPVIYAVGSPLDGLMRSGRAKGRFGELVSDYILPIIEIKREAGATDAQIIATAVKDMKNDSLARKFSKDEIADFTALLLNQPACFSYYADIKEACHERDKEEDIARYGEEKYKEIMKRREAAAGKGKNRKGK